MEPLPWLPGIGWRCGRSAPSLIPIWPKGEITTPRWPEAGLFHHEPQRCHHVLAVDMGLDIQLDEPAGPGHEVELQGGAAAGTVRIRFLAHRVNMENGLEILA